MTRDSQPGMTRPLDGLALIGQVASLLNTGLGAEETVARVAESLRKGLGAEAVEIWLREPNAATMRSIGAPARPSRAVAILPETDQPNLRLPLLHEGERLGTLELRPPPAADVTEAILPVVANILAPFLASIELSEDLAYEVALRSREIEEQRRFITLVIDSLPVGLYVVDREYRIQIWNRKRELGTQGLRRDEVVGRPVFEVLTRQNAGQMRTEIDDVFASGQTRQIEIEVEVGPDTKYYRISKVPMRQEGQGISHVLTIGEDVTDAHVVQQRIMQSEKLAAIGQLAAGIMHEINNPLATIGACIAALHNQVEDEVAPEHRAKLEEYLDIIDKEVQRCEGIVDGLLDFSRPKGKAKSPVNIGHLLEDTLFLLKHHERFKKIEVRREISDQLPPVLANPEQLIQVFMALMLNSLDAMEGGGSLTIRTLPGAVNGDELEIQIEDTGAGIPRHDLAKIFEPFYTTKPPGRGTGLGLSICYGIVADHRGRIEVESQAGRGSLFRVFLPVLGERPSPTETGAGETT
ncbi:MAG: ATP-binding protein [Gemmatimonadota bacterium]|nr:ATP-binding protein [Gemmatimonadota bacterium]